ncbi:MAG: hypothetical protein GF331_15870 [Chitinivibrionales bacterium]|nr:hypothetical protein [Chitinivibrionales bacterium]
MKQDKADRKRLRHEYKRMFSEARRIVNTSDPEGLLGMHAPEDEYEDEVATILRELKTCRDADDVYALVTSVFNEAFGPERRQFDLRSLAEELWRWWSVQMGQ